MPASKITDGLGPDSADPGFGIYVHWPFCESKCPYCDFNSHVGEKIDHKKWRQAYEAEIAWAAETIAEQKKARPVVTSIFFGGGTPSLMPPETADAALVAIRRYFILDENIEITLEANPSSVEAGRFQGYRDAGINRVSLGVQSFDDQALRFLGRRHDSAAAHHALGIAAMTFSRFSLDLMYALPDQTIESWKNSLKNALLYNSNHLSLYQLTIESGTPFARNGVQDADDGVAERLFRVSRKILCDAGLPAYEISNHARPGAECHHNLLYWRSGEYAGIGPGAHGRLRNTSGQWSSHYRIHNPARWLQRVDSTGHGTVKETVLTPAERLDEVILTGLRLQDGLSRDDFGRATGLTFEDALDPHNLSILVEGGFLRLDNLGLKATEKGQWRLNSVIARLLS